MPRLNDYITVNRQALGGLTRAQQLKVLHAARDTIAEWISLTEESLHVRTDAERTAVASELTAALARNPDVIQADTGNGR